ncbi:histidine phosphatase family protein [Streptomyces sp. NBC_00572]|uniref:histidine phosphatase family protein n=1 Tax=Streptomyces sp. NBC_00572 TaxID=2903664 RepID=UPI00224D006D|nr:histidine phosphatase family protein [Streptomyces sp. NBC_00572]MCX4985252.1 histidine phosphatase family protein [Streptomyces sp. NBC_00572]
MTVRLTLISPATSGALRDVGFDDDSPLDPEGIARAESLASAVGPSSRAYSSPSARCRRTAEALGLPAEPVTELAGCAMGRWRGQTLAAVAAAEEAAVGAWLSDPTAAPHGGESLRALRVRVGAWLDGLRADSGRVTVVAEPDVIRAALVHALGAPDEAAWRLDVRPLTAVHLSGRAERWNLRVGDPLVPAQTPTATGQAAGRFHSRSSR